MTTDIATWLKSNNPDEHCDVLRKHPSELLPIVAARCAKRLRRVRLNESRDGDPCVCGYAGVWHSECYWWFSKDNPDKPATDEFALPWRKKISKEVKP